jgi:hypothetical protein
MPLPPPLHLFAKVGWAHLSPLKLLALHACNAPIAASGMRSCRDLAHENKRGKMSLKTLENKQINYIAHGVQKCLSYQLRVRKVKCPSFFAMKGCKSQDIVARARTLHAMLLQSNYFYQPPSRPPARPAAHYMLAIQSASPFNLHSVMRYQFRTTERGSRKSHTPSHKKEFHHILLLWP